ncbi:MAG: pflD [Herbinix sp.]|jgi:formate C-acetyltransferase|nr:pflD [Herbinix sp.]
MTEHIKNLLEQLQSRSYRLKRIEKEMDVTEKVLGKSAMLRDAVLLETMLDNETPVFIDGDSIGFYRSVSNFSYFMEDNKRQCPYPPGNITPNYQKVMEKGFDTLLSEIEELHAQCNMQQKEFYEALLITMKAALRLADRYTEEAYLVGNDKLYMALLQVPHRGASSFYEACVFMKFIILTIRCNRNMHVTLGRFDQYMYPYFERDVIRGVPEEELFESLEEFFISINFDTDLYPGVQQGDNGQSMVLGGRDGNGNDCYNRLSELCMKASLELNLIDPKINLRVNKDTPMERYLYGTQLTKKGLGFPQYCNDDVVLPGLVALGYDYEDAVNYTVAACWEYIIPNCGMDIPNIITMNFPKVVNNVIHSKISQCNTFEKLLDEVKQELKKECERLQSQANRTQLTPSPYLSLFIDGCVEKGADLSEGAAKYNNYGCHGAGISSAADALAAVKKMVYDDCVLECNHLIDALDKDFEGFEELRLKLLECPKMGNNDPYVDNLAYILMDTFALEMNGKKNNRGGIFRAGTGSALEYLWSAKQVTASADGRKAYQPYGSSFSPSITARLKGPLSMLQSFTNFDMRKIINGGPLTIEIHDTTFRNEMGVEKVAQLVKTYIDFGGHQLQLNSINRERLLEAKKHPEKYPNLIVRVWGWSGYFNELDPEYQDHIISRTEYMV